MLEDVIKDWGGFEVSAMDVYSNMFQFGEGYLQNKGKQGEGNGGELKANPIAYFRKKGIKTGHYRVLFEDDFERCLKECQQADFCILNGITYFGRKNVQSHASKMFAMIFDLDGVTDDTLNNFFSGAFRADVYPIPNYVILSGHNVHLYYLFEKPIPLYPNIKVQLKEFKYQLTRQLWNGVTSTSETIQNQGINQGFRVIGGKTKEGAIEKTVRAFEVNSHPFNLDQLGKYIEACYRVDESKIFKETKMSLADAKRKYPEWYQKVVVNKNRTRNRWKIEDKVNGDNPYALYDWWLEKIRTGAAYNHRYFCIMTLAIYAAKCGVAENALRNDAYELLPLFNNIMPSEPFTEEDIESALECYDLRYVTFPIKDIVNISAIQISKNKRNGRRQEVHMRRIQALRDNDYPDGSWRNKNGAPKKEEIVRMWQQDHPEGTKAECIRDTGLSKNTVYKWWSQPNGDYNIDIVQEKLDDNLGDKYVIEDSSFNKAATNRFMSYVERMRKINKTK